MNKKELIKEVKEIGIYGLNIFGTVVEGVPTKTAIKLIKQLDEPEKVVVPQFVADYIEFQKKNNFHVYGAMRVIEDHYDKRVPEWFYEKNIETFAHAWLDGYEVNKEKRYLVKLKAVDQYLVSIKDENFLGFLQSRLRSKFTRKELDDASFGWVFDCEGIEIEEVEE